jgi:hypothetical protein
MISVVNVNTGKIIIILTDYFVRKYIFKVVPASELLTYLRSAGFQ